jgi:hypothetical protein
LPNFTGVAIIGCKVVIVVILFTFCW